MKIFSSDKIFKLVLAAFFVRAATAAAKAFLPFDLPHVWRQVDTLGVSIRYWLRWTVEPELHHPLVPAVLNSMDGYAFMPMEFPLMNLLGAPFFALGPAAGRTGALLFLFAVHFLLTWLCYRSWKDKIILGRKVGWAFLLLPVVGISSTFITKFMPDYLAMLLVLWGVSFLWDKQTSESSSGTVTNEIGGAGVLSEKGHEKGVSFGSGLFAIFLMTLGLLVKPTSVTVLVLLLLRDAPWMQRISRSLWAIPALLCAALYYTAGLKWMSSLQDTIGLFAVQSRNPWTSLVEFLAEPASIFKLVFENMAFTAAPVFFAVVFLFSASTIRVRILWLTAALLMQTVAIAALDGSHSFIHSYYHIGTSPIVALLVVISVEGALDAGGTKMKWMLGILAALVLSLIYKNTFFELRSLSGRKAERYIWPSEIQGLKDRNPSFPWSQGYTFRATRTLAYPNLGIYFGEREGSSSAEFGFYLNSEMLPPHCQMVDKSQSVSLVRCRD